MAETEAASDKDAAPAKVSLEEKKQGIILHLIELRDRLLRMVLAVLLFVLLLFPFANDIYTFLAGPLTAHLPEGSTMIAIDVASPFLIPFKLVLMVAIFIAIPYILAQIWGFIAPGLYKKEKRLAVPLLVSSVLLFYAGVAFAYFIVFPLVFGFFTSIAPEGVSVMTDIGRYLDFVITLFFAFGAAFEVPIATILLVLAGVTTPDKLVEKRAYVIVGAFVIGMVLTPPDIISQILLAFPMWLLFELGIIFSRLIVRSGEKKEEDDASNDDEDSAPVVSGNENSIAAAAVSKDQDAADESGFVPMTDQEMETELDKTEQDDERADEKK